MSPVERHTKVTDSTAVAAAVGRDCVPSRSRASSRFRNAGVRMWSQRMLVTGAAGSVGARGLCLHWQISK